MPVPPLPRAADCPSRGPRRYCPLGGRGGRGMGASASAGDQVAIVGAGPVGLVLALCLARAGIPSTVLEAEADISEELRASTFHPPTLDMLDALGLAAPLVAQGLVTPDWQIRQHAT